LWQRFELAKTGLSQLIIAVGARDAAASLANFFGRNWLDLGKICENYGEICAWMIKFG